MKLHSLLIIILSVSNSRGIPNGFNFLHILKLLNIDNDISPEAARELGTKFLLILEGSIGFAELSLDLNNQLEDLSRIYNEFGIPIGHEDMEKLLQSCDETTNSLRKNVLESDLGPLEERMKLLEIVGTRFKESINWLHVLRERMIHMNGKLMAGYAKFDEGFTKQSILLEVLSARIRDTGITGLGVPVVLMEMEDSEVRKRGEMVIQMANQLLSYLMQIQDISDKLETLGYFTNSTAETPQFEEQLIILNARIKILINLIENGNGIFGNGRGVLSYALKANQIIRKKILESKKNQMVLANQFGRIERIIEQLDSAVTDMAEFKEENKHEEL